jgi:UDP-3-O-[3-hydroxymyristoyl] glucosamine N-acyltransferase
MTAAFPAPVTVAELAERFDGTLRRGDPAARLKGLASLRGAVEGDLSFLVGPGGRHDASLTRATAVLVGAALASAVPQSAAVVVVADPYATYGRVARWIDDARQAALDAKAQGIHPSAIISPSARIASSARVGAGSVVADGAELAAGVVLGAGCYVGHDASVGEGTRFHAHVTLLDRCEVGARCIVHSGTVIGSDGFGFAPAAGRWEKIPQLGRVLVGNDVEIGSNCSLDRGALDDTIVGDGCKLDNLIQIAHNVRIGEHSALAGCVGVAGSAVIGKRCRIGGSAGILGHLEICDDVTISAMSLVSRSIREPGFYTGVFPLMENAQWERSAATLKRLPELRSRLRIIERHSGNG